MVEKILHQSDRMEFGAPKAALFDRLAYDIRREIEVNGSAAPLLEDLLNLLRSGDFRPMSCSARKNAKPSSVGGARGTPASSSSAPCAIASKRCRRWSDVPVSG